MNELIERVLAIGSGFAPINGTCLVRYGSPMDGDVFPIALHRQLLQIGGEAAEIFVVRQNGDGLRVGLTSSVLLEDTVIEGNGDTGVVVMNDSEVVLIGGVISKNGGVAVSARDQASLELHGVSVRENRGGEAELLGRASLTRYP